MMEAQEEEEEEGTAVEDVTVEGERESVEDGESVWGKLEEGSMYVRPE